VKLIRKIISWFLKLLTGIISLLILYLLIALILTLIPVNSDFEESDNGTDIFISSNGVHINIIIPTSNNWIEQFNPNKKYKYHAFGWGDQEFYMSTPNWSDLKVSTALSAAFLPSQTVIQVYGLRKTPRITKNTRKLRLSEEQFEILSHYIYHSFQLNEENEPSEIFSENDESVFYKYYQAKGKYSLFFTCNNWANRGLKKAGIKNAVWAPFDKSVLYHLN